MPLCFVHEETQTEVGGAETNILCCEDQVRSATGGDLVLTQWLRGDGTLLTLITATRSRAEDRRPTRIIQLAQNLELIIKTKDQCWFIPGWLVAMAAEENAGELQQKFNNKLFIVNQCLLYDPISFFHQRLNNVWGATGWHIHLCVNSALRIQRHWEMATRRRWGLWQAISLCKPQEISTFSNSSANAVIKTSLWNSILRYFSHQLIKVLFAIGWLPN